VIINAQLKGWVFIRSYGEIGLTAGSNLH